jgi:hypothetical protein
MEPSDFYDAPISKVLHFIRSVGLIKGLSKGKHSRPVMFAVQGPDGPRPSCIHTHTYIHGMDDRGVGFRVPVGSRIFTSPCPDRLWSPPSLVSKGYRGLVPPGVKRPGREAHHLPPTSAEVKKTWIYTATLPYVFMA